MMFNPKGLHDLNELCNTSSVKGKSLGPRMQSTDTDLKIRKALATIIATIALHDMTEI